MALDNDIKLVSNYRQQGNNHVAFGDCNNLEILKSCQIHHARLVILSIKNLSDAVKIINRIRCEYPDLPVIVRAHHESAFEELILAGANHIVPEMLETSFMISMQMLSLLGIHEQNIIEQIQRERDRRMAHLSSSSNNTN